MIRHKRWRSLIVASLPVLIAFSGCTSADRGERTVVVYTSVDQVYSEPIFREFERISGIRVLPAYDVEAAKTTGLVNRLLAEKDHPQADVFWNGEFVHTLFLKEKGVLSPYPSPAAGDIPSPYRDPEGYWACTAARARVLLVNRELVPPSRYPSSLFTLVSSGLPPDRVGIACPVFGTSATHAAALYSLLGREQGKKFYESLYRKKVRVVDGNSLVRDMVADGRLLAGITDTDDACGAKRKGAPVEIIFPDQGRTGIGTLVIPGSVALIAGGKHPDEARKLVDFLLSREVEGKLVASGWSHLPLRGKVGGGGCVDGATVKAMGVGPLDAYRMLGPARKDMAEIFIR
ncbi:MAG: extracellular solute-binding protein [Geobacteraceae bacterium]|nr:extracellular solute-binding protein [Geobacteraceae bacterium]